MPAPLAERLALLSDAARFDAPCVGRRTPAPAARGGRTPLPVLPEGSTVGPALVQESTGGDGRPIRLLRLLLSSHCVHDCAYCPLRRSADPARARLAVREVVRATMEHHRAGLIDGLFLSSAVDRDPDATMEALVAVARTLRREEHYLGYVHLKIVPEADPALLDEAARWADRVSVNVELPSQARLDRLAPGRRLATMTRAMDRLRDGIADAHEGWRWRVRGGGLWPDRVFANGRIPRYAPAGQVTQLVVGADDASDAELLHAASGLYRRERMRRVYYGGFVPTVGQPDFLPDVAAPAMREARLYQADWLIRNSGFSVEELAPADAPDLARELDPKLAWALRHPERFPVELQRAPREELLRVPGLGRQSVERLLVLRTFRRVRLEDLARMGAPVRRVMPFVVTADHRPTGIARLPERARGTQLELFGSAA